MFNLFKSPQRKLFDKHIDLYNSIKFANPSDPEELRELQDSAASLEQSKLYVTLNPLRSSLPRDIDSADPYQLKRLPESPGLVFHTDSTSLPGTSELKVQHTLADYTTYRYVCIASTQLASFLKSAAHHKLAQRNLEVCKPLSTLLGTEVSIAMMDLFNSLQDATTQTILYTDLFTQPQLDIIADHLGKDLIIQELQ